jgi:hypothetical protein
MRRGQPKGINRVSKKSSVGRRRMLIAWRRQQLAGAAMRERKPTADQPLQAIFSAQMRLVPG